MPERRISLPSAVSTPVLARPVISDMSGVGRIDNSELRKIAEDALAAAKYSYASVAADPTQSVRANTLEADFKEAFSKMNATRQKNISEKAAQMTNLSEPARLEIFGRYGKIDSKSFLAQGFDRVQEGLEPLKIDTKLLGVRTPTFSVPAGVKLEFKPEGILLPKEHLVADYEGFEADWEEAAKTAEKSEIYNAEHLEEIWGPVYTEDPFETQMVEAGEFEEQAVTDKLAFYIRRVKCVDETNPEWWGSDEIAIAGVSVDETGDTKKIGETFVGGGFDDGDTKWYSPSWKYHWFSLREGTRWPKGYSVTLILAEKDWGGLSSVLNTVWVRIRDYVKRFIQRYVEAGLAAWIGPVLAYWLGRIVAWVVNALVGWIIRAFADDIFPPFVASVRIPGFNYRWPGGSTRSPYRYAHFYGHGGHYYAEYRWGMYA